MKWYADNSELNANWGAEIPDILFFGGVAINTESERSLAKVFEEITKAHSDIKGLPLKWNFKDLKTFYARRELADVYQALLRESKNWRKRFWS